MLRTLKLIAVPFLAIGSLAALPADAADNVPPVRSAAQLARESQLQRATQAVLWGLPAASMMAFRRGIERDLGGTYNDVIYLSQPMVARHSFLTANNQTPYVLTMIDTTAGPVVIEVPAASPQAVFFGSANDAWMVPVVDVGPQGDDAGKGGKFLFLPPGYDQAVPQGYLAVRPATYHAIMALRPIAVGTGKLADAVEYSKRLKVYPLAQADNPPPNRYIDAYPKAWNTLPTYDLDFFTAIAQVVNEEPTQPKDLAMTGMLASLGIVKGQPFAPGAEMQATLSEAAQLAAAMLQADLLTPGKSTVPFWPGSQWAGFNFSRDVVGGGFTFTDGNQLQIDQRARTFQWLTFPPKKLGKGTFYLVSLRDKTGQLLDGTSTYRLRVPAGVPVSQFWAINPYSTKTKSFIATAERVGISSYDKQALKTNADGSVDVYFAPQMGKVPKEMAGNWLPTGEDFFLMFRFYGPQPALLQKTWSMSDLEIVQ